jgi:SPP1 family predicted phage head-tail adaptor
MDSFELDRRVTLLRKSVTRDAANSPVEAWVTLATVWASKKDVSDAERVRAEEIGASITARFQIHKTTEVASLSARDRVQLAGLTYDISGVKEIGRERLEITATARADLT